MSIFFVPSEWPPPLQKACFMGCGHLPVSPGKAKAKAKAEATPGILFLVQA